MTPRELIQATAEAFGVTTGELLLGPNASPRRVVMYVMSRKGRTQRRIARTLKIHERTVHVGVQFVRWRLRLDPNGKVATVAFRLTTSTQKESS